MGTLNSFEQTPCDSLLFFYLVDGIALFVGFTCAHSIMFAGEVSLKQRY